MYLEKFLNSNTPEAMSISYDPFKSDSLSNRKQDFIPQKRRPYSRKISPFASWSSSGSETPGCLLALCNLIFKKSLWHQSPSPVPESSSSLSESSSTDKKINDLSADPILDEEEPLPEKEIPSLWVPPILHPELKNRVKAFILNANQLPQVFQDRKPNLKKYREDPCFLSRLIHFFNRMNRTGVKKVSGGNKAVYFFDDFPEIVVKMPKNFEKTSPPKGMNKEAALSEEELSNEATQLCKDHNFYYLYPPQTIAFSFVFKGRVQWGLIQEKMPLNAQMKFQKGFFRFIQTTPELTKYCKGVFDQLTEFTLRFNLGDVKLNNVSVAYSGIISLHDLEKAKVFGEGLYQSRLKNKNKGGVFRTAIGSEAKDLNKKVQAYFQNSPVFKSGGGMESFTLINIENHLAKREDRLEKLESYIKWAKEKEIKELDEAIRYEKTDLEKLFEGVGKFEKGELAELAVNILDDLNQWIKKPHNKFGSLKDSLGLDHMSFRKDYFFLNEQFKNSYEEFDFFYTDLYRCFLANTNLKQQIQPEKTDKCLPAAELIPFIELFFSKLVEGHYLHSFKLKWKIESGRTFLYYRVYF